MADTIFCSRCGTPLNAQSQFCTRCGAVTALPFAQQQPATTQPPPPLPVAMPAPAPAPQMTQPPQPYSATAPAPAYAPQAAFPGMLPYAGFWMRVGAYLLDVLILIIPMAMINFVPVIGFIASVAGPWLYFALQESSEYQATLGKRALNIYVTDMQGRRISFGQATGRHFGKILSFLILCIGYMMAGFTEQKQALHDMMAGTLVKRR